MFQKPRQKLVQLPVEKIVPNLFQPRRVFDPGGIDALADSIRQNGLIQPITVTRFEKQYMLVAGERRLRAVRQLGWPLIDAVVVQMDDRQKATAALAENLQRQELHFFEQAEAMAALISAEICTREDLCTAMGLAQSTLSNRLRLLKLSEDARQIVTESNLTERHARALLALPPERQKKAAAVIAARGYNVAEAERYIAALTAPKKTKAHPKGSVKDVRIFLNSLNRAVEKMKQAGVPAVAEADEKDGFIEYRVQIPTR